jgi:hypothetical protein
VPDPRFSDEFYERWEHLISTVEITDVPMRFIREVSVQFNSNENTVFDVQHMLLMGEDPQNIEEEIELFLYDNDEDIASVDFHINITALATEVEHKTNKLLDE